MYATVYLVVDVEIFLFHSTYTILQRIVFVCPKKRMLKQQPRLNTCQTLPNQKLMTYPKSYINSCKDAPPLPLEVLNTFLCIQPDALFPSRVCVCVPYHAMLPYASFFKFHTKHVKRCQNGFLSFVFDNGVVSGSAGLLPEG